ncbi:hypothetical protein LTR65_004479 [Meristemomyces frigidus]
MLPDAIQFLSPSALSNESFSALDEYDVHPRFLELQNELRTLLFASAQSAAPTRQHTPDLSAEGQSPPRLPGYRSLLQHLRIAQCQIPILRIIEYLRVWVSECAPWLDMFDEKRAFGVSVPVLAQTSPTVLFALLALSARQMARSGSAAVASQDSLELYSTAIASLTPALERKDESVLVAACILCALEMMSASPRDWRRHVEGCAALFEASSVHGFCGGSLQGVFWCYARMDLCGALIVECAESTVLPIGKWVLPETAAAGFDERAISEAFMAHAEQTPDMHANYAVYMCAKVCDLIAKRSRYVELGDDNGCDTPYFHNAWLHLWEELQLWAERRAPIMRPIMVIAGSAVTHHFPSVLYAHWGAISGNQLYHTSCILMLEVQATVTVSAATNLVHSPLWHARQIVGISLANSHKGCLNNAIQPLWIAGRIFTYRAEHKVVVDLLNYVEMSSGWAARWRIKDLEVAWGYPRGTFTHLRPG